MSRRRRPRSRTRSGRSVVVDNGVHAADAYGGAVVTSYVGKSTITETYERAAGVFGSFDHEGANQLVSEADVLLIVGCSPQPDDTNR